MLESLLINYGYWAVFIGAMLEGESFLILGGFLAHRGYLQLPWVMLMGLLGGMCSDHFCFYLGRHHSQKLLALIPTWKIRIDKIQEWLARVHTPLILGFRFLYGFRAVTPFVIGMSSISFRRFALLESIGACFWAGLLGLGGYLFGAVLQKMLGDVKRQEKYILLGIVAVALIVWLLHFLRNRQNRSASKSRAA